MPHTAPVHPRFAADAERRVHGLLLARLGADDVLLSSPWTTVGAAEVGTDLLVGLAGVGVVAVAVRGGAVWHDGARWRGPAGGARDDGTHPVEEARAARFALRDALEADPRWRGRSRVRWAHAVVLPEAQLPAGATRPDLPRWAAVDALQLDDLVGLLRAVAVHQPTACRAPDADDLRLLAAVLHRPADPRRSLPLPR